MPLVTEGHDLRRRRRPRTGRARSRHRLRSLGVRGRGPDRQRRPLSAYRRRRGPPSSPPATKASSRWTPATARCCWHREPDGVDPIPFYSGTPLVHSGTLYVPISSLEIGLSAIPFYGCCETSGGFAAMDAATGDTRWYLRTIAAEARTTGVSLAVRRQAGSVRRHRLWGAPMLDAGRGLVFFGTGQNYSHPTTDTSDAIFAVEAATGARRWVRQITTNDAYNISCDFTRAHPNCPDPLGPDLDFGAPPVLATLSDGSEAVVVGQKSGDVYALRPDDGVALWQTRLGPRRRARRRPLGHRLQPGGGTRGRADQRHRRGAHDRTGAHPNPACLRAQRRRRANSPGRTSAHPGAKPGSAGAASPRPSPSRTRSSLRVASMATSKRSMLARENCSGPSTLGATSTPSTDPPSAGAFDAHGPMVADDLVIVTSGYGSFGQRGGNALLVFGLGP